jgi:hypothetical protein
MTQQITRRPYVAIPQRTSQAYPAHMGIAAAAIRERRKNEVSVWTGKEPAQ